MAAASLGLRQALRPAGGAGGDAGRHGAGLGMTGEGMAVPQGLAKRLEAIVGRMGP